MEYRKFGDTYVLRLDQGEEVMESLRRFAEAEQISLASVQGIGALSAFDLKAHHYEGCYEITSLLGTIDTMDGQFYCHLHLNAAEQDDRPVGGHLTRAVIRVTGELIVRVLDGQVERAMDPVIDVNTGIFPHTVPVYCRGTHLTVYRGMLTRLFTPRKSL